MPDSDNDIVCGRNCQYFYKILFYLCSVSEDIYFINWNIEWAFTI